MLNFDPALLGPYFRHNVIAATPQINTTTSVVPANSQRVGIEFWLTVGGATIQPVINGIGADGWTLSLQPTTVKFLFADRGSLVGCEWRAVTGAVAARIIIVETIFAPPGGD